MKTILFFLGALLSISLQAQTVDSLKINAKKQEIVLSNSSITAKTEIAALIKILGTPDRIEKAVGKDRYYIYDKLGISFDAGKNGLVEAIMVTYNPDSDKKAAKEKFAGKLLLDNLLISEKTSSDNIKQATSIKEIVCMGTSICMSDPKSPSMTLMIGYNDKASITQIVLGFAGHQ